MELLRWTKASNEMPKTVFVPSSSLFAFPVAKARTQCTEAHPNPEAPKHKGTTTS